MLLFYVCASKTSAPVVSVKFTLFTCFLHQYIKPIFVFSIQLPCIDSITVEDTEYITDKSTN